MPKRSRERGRAVLRIDLHHHCVPREYLDAAARGDFGARVSLSRDGRGNPTIIYDGVAFDRRRQVYPVMPRYYDLELRLQEMNGMGLDAAVISAAPIIFHYWDEPQRATEVSRVNNDAIARLVRGAPGLYVGLGQVALQDTELAIVELQRCMRELGFAGVQIGSNVDGEYLGSDRLRPFFAAAAALDALLLIHPYNGAGADRMTRYYIRNSIGNPLDTSLAMADLVFAGRLEEFPNLKLVLCHAGGLLPYVSGRVDHTWRVRPESKTIPAPPSFYFKKMWYDTITHDSEALAFLIGSVGAGQVVLGSDYPFDMADMTPLARVAALPLTTADRAAVYGGNARALLGEAARALPGTNGTEE